MVRVHNNRRERLNERIRLPMKVTEDELGGTTIGRHDGAAKVYCLVNLQKRIKMFGVLGVVISGKKFLFLNHVSKSFLASFWLAGVRSMFILK